ncbi:MAG: GatB/YqeY domain-containing protein [Actinobacteria bacterium]|nr:GatB/YqeY domain-containing protein [Actinomycetota bacterium]
MSLIVLIEEELREAMRARDRLRADTLRLTLSSLRAAEKELQRPLGESEELQVLQRERKRRTEAAEAFREAGREEQADAEDAELAVIEEFMPEPVSEEELERIVDDAIAETGATSLRDLGRVMADVMPQVAGRADGSTVSRLVREKLA